MTARAQATTTLRLVANDEASRKISRVKDELRDTERVTAHLGKAGEKTADTSGKLSTALSSLGDFAGSMEGDMRRASEAAGLLDDVMTVLPGPIGLAAGALTGLAAVLVLNRVESQRTRAAIAEVAKPGTVDQVKDLADAFDLNREGAVALAEALRDSDEPADQLIYQIRGIVHQAEAVGRDASADVVKFAQSIKRADDNAEKLRLRLKEIRKAQADAAEAETFAFGDPLGAGDFVREANKAIEAYSQGVSDARAELKKFNADLVEQNINLGQRADLRDQQAKIIDKIKRAEGELANAETRKRRVIQLAREDERVEAEEREKEFQRQIKAASRTEKATKRVAKARREAQQGIVVEGIDITDIIKEAEYEENARKFVADAKRKETEATLELMEAEFQLARAKRQNLTRLAEEARLLDEGQIRQAEAVKDAYFGAAKGLLQTAAATAKSEKIRNAALAVSAAGDAVYFTAKALAATNPARKVQLFAAAGQAAIAAGIYGGKAVLGGRGAGGGGSAAGGAGGGSRALTAEGGAGGGGAGGETTINVNFPGFVIGRQEEVAKQMGRLSAPLAGTGYGVSP